MRQRSDRSLARTGLSGDVTRARGTRWPWLIVAIVVAALKVEAYASLLEHRGALIGALAVALVVSVVRLRPKPLLIASLFTISTVLHARQQHAVATPGGR